MIGILTEAGSYLLVWAMGAGTALFLRRVLKAPRPTDTPVEGIDGLDRALDTATAASDLPTQGLPRHSPGTVYSSRHRRAGKGGWLAGVGRSNPRRVVRQGRHLP